MNALPRHHIERLNVIEVVIARDERQVMLDSRGCNPDVIVGYRPAFGTKLVLHIPRTWLR